MVSVEIADNQSAFAIDRKWFKDLVRFVCDQEQIKSAKLSLAFVDNATIHGLNKRFLQHDYPTDVLTFPLGKGKTLEGEVVLSGEYAVEECVEYDWPAHMEASLYVVHGVLHLCGYDDRDEVDADRMKERQEALLREFARGSPERRYGGPPPARPPEESE
jgi:probable rRNA maturation factor